MLSLTHEALVALFRNRPTLAAEMLRDIAIGVAFLAAEGEVKAKAQDVLAVLEARGLEVPADLRERVLACTDLAELDRWSRAAVVGAAREIFAQ